MSVNILMPALSPTMTEGTLAKWHKQEGDAVQPGACQQARRRAPTFESDKDANSFALTLDWSEEAVDVDTYWQTLVGVHLTQRQAAVLHAVASVASATIPVIESATAMSAEDVAEAIDFLLLQRVVEQDEANFRLAQHLREKLG